MRAPLPPGASARRSRRPTPRIALAGGVFRHSDVVRRVFTNSVRAERPATTVLEDVEPVLGALSLARKGGAA